MTRPIETLEFPGVTVCPPLGSNTALNYDLIKADNQSLTEQDRENLKQEIYNIFLKSSHMTYVSSMEGIMNSKNVDLVYEGFQSVPIAYGESGFEVLIRGTEGSIETSQFKEIFDEGSFRDDKLYHLVLEIPDDLKDQMASGTLVIELEVDIRQAEGWKEEVHFLKGHGYTRPFPVKNWEGAKAHCESEGKRLAAVLSEWEQKQVDSLTSPSIERWLGGTDVEQEGEWKWTDGSPFRFTRWDSNPYTMGAQGTGFNCLQNLKKDKQDKGYWRDIECTKPSRFLCQEAPNIIQGSAKLVWRYTKEQLWFSAFQVWYKLKAANQGQLDAWKDKRMTGCKLSWRVENTPLTLTSNEVGRMIITPNFGQQLFESSYFESAKSYIVHLEFTEHLKNQIGDGELMIQLEVDMYQAEGWEETLTYTGESKQFSFVEEKKTWDEAEVFCQKRGGHLASILSESEQREMFSLAAGDYDYQFLSYPNAQPIWVGGTDKEKEGSWQWSDGSFWLLPAKPSKDFGKNGDENDCLEFDGLFKDWHDRNCSNELAFICEQRSNVIRGMSFKNLTFNQNQLYFSSLFFWYNYWTPEEVLDEWFDKRVTGFKLSWFIQDKNGTRVTEELPARTEDWKSIGVSPTYDTDELLSDSVQLASRLHKKKDESMALVISKIVEEKINIKNIPRKNTDYLSNSFCPEEGIGISQQFALRSILGKLIGNKTTTDITKDDMKFGFAIYSATVFCSNTPKQLYKFFFDLVSKETPRSILMVLVNTIRSSSVKGFSDKLLLNKFYLYLDKVLKLSYGDILLATSSKEDLKKIIDNDWPFLTNNTAIVKKCLNGDQCDNALELTKTSGRQCCKIEMLRL